MLKVEKCHSVYGDQYYYLKKNDDREWELIVESILLENTNADKP
jgi:hypothetical protein